MLEKPPIKPNPLNTILKNGQLLSILLFILTNPLTFDLILWHVQVPLNIPPENRGVVIFAPDIAVMGLIGITGLRLIVDWAYRSDMKTAVQKTSFRWLLLAGWLGFGILYAQYRRLVAYNLFHLLLGIALMVIVAQLIAGEDGWMLLVGLVLAAGFHGFFAIAQALKGGALGLWMFGEIQNYYVGVPIFRSYGLSSNPNNLGGFIITGLYGGLLFLNRRRQHELWLTLLVAAGGLFAGLGLLATMSRSAIGALVLTLGLVVAAFPPFVARHSLLSNSPEQPPAADQTNNHDPSVVPPTIPTGVQRAGTTTPIAEITFSFVLPALIVAIPGLLALTVGMAIFGPSLVARFTELADLQVVLDRVFGTYPHTMAIIRQHPLLGVGANNLLLAISQLPVEFVTRPQPAHNVYFAMWAELGILGPPLFILAVGQIVTQLRRRDGIRAFIAGAGVLAWCLIMLIDYYPWGDPRSRLMFFLVMGLWWGYRLRNGQQQS
jgi:hypothetical protein